MILEDINKLLQKGEGIKVEFKAAEKGIPRDSSLSNTTWDEILLYLVPRWSQKGEIIIIIDEQFTHENRKKLTDFYGTIPDFPERVSQGNYEERESL